MTESQTRFQLPEAQRILSREIYFKSPALTWNARELTAMDFQHIFEVTGVRIDVPYIKIKRCSTETDGPHGIEASFKGVSSSCETTSLNGGSGSSVDCAVAI